MSYFSNRNRRRPKKEADQRWKSRLADLVERRLPDGTYEAKPKPVLATIPARSPRPQMLPRPPGMSRQVQRRLYREACKSAGVSWRSNERR